MPKSPWKYHKIPTISTNGVPGPVKSLLSCVLWRLHEYENNPLMPESYVLLTNDVETRTVAQKLSIPTFNLQELRQAFEKKNRDNVDREVVGQLEIEFAVKRREKVAAEVEEDVNMEEEKLVCDGEKNLDVTESTDQNARSVGSEEKTLNGDAISHETRKVGTATEFEGSNGNLEQAEKPREEFESLKLNGVYKLDKEEETVKDVDLHSPKPLSDNLDGIEKTTSPPPETTAEAPSTATPEVNITKTQQSSSVPTNGHVNGIVNNIVGASDDSDDDDEVVVFNPKSRRLSGRPKTPIEVTKPPPAISYIKALETGLPKKPIPTPKPTLPAEQTQSQSTHQPEIPSQVKTESQSQPPIWPQSQGAGSARKTTSGQRRHPNRRPEHLQYPSNTASKAQNQMSAHPMPAQIQPRPIALPTEMQIRSKSASPPKSLERKKSDEQIILESVDQNNGRHHNQMDIQRPNHPAVQRVDQAFAKPQRQSHKQQRSFPIIDPDAFDRSFIIRPNNNAPNNNHRIMSPRGSPRGTPRTPETEVDYVLKSGSPRAATRGRGKLWVP